MLDGVTASGGWSNGFSRGATLNLPAVSRAHASDWVSVSWFQPQHFNKLVGYFTTSATRSLPAAVTVTYWSGTDWVPANNAAVTWATTSNEPSTITFDPVHDTPEVLANYVHLYDVDAASWTFLTGPPEQVATAIKAWDMWARPAANGQLDAGHGIKNVAACDCVGYAVAELGIAVADLVRERAGREVQSDYVRGRIVDVGKWLESIGHERFHGPVLFVGEAIEGVIVVADLPIELGNAIGITKWRAEPAGETREWRARGYLIEEVLLDALGIHKEEQLVLDDGST